MIWLKRIAVTVAALVGLIAAAVAAVVMLIENGTLNPFIERRASAALGRQVRLAAPPDLLFGWPPGVAIGPLSVGNPAWAGTDAPMATVERAEARLDLMGLLGGELVIPRVTIDAPRADLRRLADGRATWQLDTGPEQTPASQEPLRLPRVELLEVRHAAVSLDDAQAKKAVDATLEARMTPDGERSKLLADLGVSDAADPAAPPATTHVEGWIDDPRAPQDGFEMTATSSGERADRLLTLAGVPTVGELPGYDLTVKVARDPQAWRLVDLDAKLGETTLEGEGSVVDPGVLDGLELTLDGKAPDPGALMAAFGLGQRAVPGLDLAVRASRDGQRNKVVVDGRLGEDDLDVEVSTEGAIAELRGLAVTAKAGGTQLGKLLPLLGLTEKPVPTYAIDATASRGDDGAVQLDGTASLGDTKLRVGGRIGDLEAFRGLDLELAMAGPDPANLLDLFGLPKISLPPYDIKGKVRREGDVIEVSGLAGRVGQSDLNGDAAVDLAAEPISVTGDLASDRLDFDDLAGLIGLPSASEEDPGASAEQKREGQAYEASDRLLPDAKIDAEAWRNLDLDIRYRGKTVNAPKLPVQDLAFHVVTRKGWLTLDPFSASIAGGTVAVFASLDGSTGPVGGDFDIRVRDLGLNAFLERFGLTNEAFGKLTGRAQLKGVGGSLRELAATADGRVVLSMAGGSVSTLIPELGGLDIGQAISQYFRTEGDTTSRKIPIRCLIGDFAVERGVMRARTVLLDTPEDKMTIEGDIDLRDETLDLMFHAFPRDASVASSRMPISIEGPIKSPTVSPAPGHVENRTLGWVLAPLAALVPFVELGSEDDHPCAGVAERVREQSKVRGE